MPLNRKDRAEQYKSKTNAMNKWRFVVKVDGHEVFSSDIREEAMAKYNIFKGDSDQVEFIDTWGGKEK